MRLGAALIGDLEKYMAEEMRHGAGAVSRGLSQVSESGKSRLRQQIVVAFGSQRLAKSWRSAVYPKLPQTSLGGAAVVWSNARKIVGAFDRAVTIRSKHGFWLAIPSPDAPKARGKFGKAISPSTFPEDRYGKLRFIYRRGKSSLLVVDGVRRTKSGRVSRKLVNSGLNKSGGYKKGYSSTVMFYLVPIARLSKRLNVGQEFTRMENAVVPTIIKEWRDNDA